MFADPGCRAVTMVVVPRAAAELHGRWTTWLLLQGASNSAVRRKLADIGLPCASPSELNRRRQELSPPRDFTTAPPFTFATKTFLEQLRLWRVAEGTSDVHRAMGVLRTPVVREIVETGLLLGVPHATIADSVQELAGWSLWPEQVEAFAALYFRMEVLTRGQLRIAIENRVRAELARVVTTDTSPAVIAGALAADVRVAAANQPPVPASWPKLLTDARLAPARWRPRGAKQ
jgi:hypothetical protein